MSARLREQLINQLTGQNAHISFKNAVKGLSADDVGIRPDNLPYSIWELVEHIRISQSDIVQFSIDPEYVSPNWPEGYWPTRPGPADEEEWNESLETIQADLAKMVDLVQDTANDLFLPFPHGDGQTLFREALLIIDHNSYHTGQIIAIRRQLGLWE